MGIGKGGRRETREERGAGRRRRRKRRKKEKREEIGRCGYIGSEDGRWKKKIKTKRGIGERRAV